jgi:hypothetical protein
MTYHRLVVENVFGYYMDGLASVLHDPVFLVDFHVVEHCLKTSFVPNVQGQSLPRGLSKILDESHLD